MADNCEHEWRDATKFQPAVAVAVWTLRCLRCGKERTEPLEPPDAPPTFKPQS